MENQDQESGQPLQTQLVVTEEMRSYLYDMARWSSFLAIVGFVFAGITIVGAFTIGAAMETNPQLAQMLGEFGALGKIIFTVFNLVVAFAIFYPSLLLFKYAAHAKVGVLYGEQANLNEAFSKLKSLFSFWGILTIICIGLYFLMILATLVG
ncbi:MAG: DUF5362 family protein [Pedobacter sp.]|nr:DUF5362 family protein [Pedobacter sp.]MDQ8053733.1 DUF5362 family protein [Pedobacter sp.]